MLRVDNTEMALAGMGVGRPGGRDGSMDDAMRCVRRIGLGPGLVAPGTQSACVGRLLRTELWSKIALMVLMWPWLASAGGSGFSTVVVVNQASSNSVALGNYYCERRQVPPQNLLRIQWTGGNIAWSVSQMEATLLAPLRAMLTNRSLVGQVDQVVLSMDIPYRVSDGSTANSSTSVLFYGFKTNPPPTSGSCVISDQALSSYAFSELNFHLSPPVTNGLPFLATMVTGRTLSLARALVDQGVTSDGTFPSCEVILEKTTDTARNVRYFAFDNAILDIRVNGQFPVSRTNSNQTLGLTNLLGLETGLATLTLSTNAFVPGAMADSLTSYAGELFENSGQTTLLAFTEAGAAGSYGTVTEPCNYQAKFPDPLNYFYQARGFNLAECYYLCVKNPYQGLIVGDPLAAPFARPGAGSWLNLETNATLSATAPLQLEFAAADLSRPLQQIDLFVDGGKLLTLTNVAPVTANELRVTLNGQTLTYSVPAQATLQSITAGLAAQINASVFPTLGRVRAFDNGDRIELDSTNVALTGTQISLSASSRAPRGGRLTTYVAAARTNFLDSTARGWRSWDVSGTAATGDYVVATVTKTNGQVVVVGVTNQSGSVTGAQLTRQLLTQINANPALTTFDGVSAEDTYGSDTLTFLLYARTQGLAAAQILVQFQSSASIQISPATASMLDENAGDLRPRNHLYVRAGVTNWTYAFSLDTTSLSDGYHQLVVVAYEGTHVCTQTRISRDVLVRNTALEAHLTHSSPWGLAKVSDILQLHVSANTNAIAVIELFSTGGSLAVASNQASVDFSVPAAQLGEGLHPFYALVKDTLGQQFRTETQWIRITNALPLVSMPIELSVFPPRLVWQGMSGYDYDVLSADEGAGPFAFRATLPVTNSGPVEWIDAESPGQRFYRVQIRAR